MEYTYIHNHQSQFIEMFKDVRDSKSLCAICRPKQWPTIPTKDFTDDGYLIYGANGIIGHYSQYNHEHSTILMACRGASCGAINISQPKSYITGNAMCMDDINDNVLFDYLAYFLSNYDYKTIITGGAQPQITVTNLQKVMVPIPPKSQQEAFGVIVKQADKSKFDGFKSQFLEWFGGDKFVSTTLPEISENLDYKRVPITSGDRNVGQFPYYGASGIVDYIDNYIFDEPLLLVSEDGANLKDRVTPIAFIAEGKYWVNNHAHVLKFTNFANMAYICHFFNFTNIEKYLTGMAQPKLNQAQLNTIKIPWPPVKMQEQFAALVEQADKSKYYEIN